MVGLAALAGMCGALVGGNGVFVMYGIAGLAYTMLQACGVVLPVFEDGVLNCFLLPCVIFNGACAAAGYAGYRGRMSGQDINHSLASLGSTTVLLVAAVGAVFGYVVVTLLNAIGFPADTGAVTVVAGGIVIRALFGRSKSGGMGAALNERETRSVGQILRDLGGAGVSFWTFQVVEGLVCAGAGTAFFRVQSMNAEEYAAYLRTYADGNPVDSALTPPAWIERGSCRVDSGGLVWEACWYANALDPSREAELRQMYEDFTAANS